MAWCSVNKAQRQLYLLPFTTGVVSRGELEDIDSHWFGGTKENCANSSGFSLQCIHHISASNVRLLGPSTFNTVQR
jgi:hypothetical protein